jgi:hypothetical protein
MSKANEIIDKKYIIPQVKYMINRTLTTEKHAKRMADIPPKRAKPKNNP